MESYTSGLFALGGTLFGGLITYAIQARAQRMENIRHRQKLAYDIAAKEWALWVERRFYEAGKSGERAETPSLVDYIVCQMRYSELLNSVDFSKMSDVEMVQALERIGARNGEVSSYFYKDLEKRTREAAQKNA